MQDVYPIIHTINIAAVILARNRRRPGKAQPSDKNSDQMDEQKSVCPNNTEDRDRSTDQEKNL